MRTLPNSAIHPHFFAGISIEAVEWLFENAGTKNCFTRDDPRPKGSTWQLNGYTAENMVVWFADPEIALRFKLQWG